MARPKKNIEPIIGAGKDPETKLTVQKSIPLFSLWRSDMTLAEFKILDTYLSRINSHEPEKRTVIFTKGELEQLLGVKKINKADLSDRLNGLGRFVEVEHSDNKLHKVALFEEAFGEMDDDGQWTVKLTCTSKAMKYIFNVEKLRYLRYKLRCITSLTSRYSYILFLYLEQNRYRKTWNVDVNELRQILNCDAEESYKEFKLFNNRILKKCQKELHEKSECRFTYEPIKKGRKVTAIRFTLETLADSIEAEVPGQLTLDDFKVFDTEEDPNQIYADVLPSDFSKEQVEALRMHAAQVVPYDPFGPLPHECQIANYLARKVAMMNASRTNKPFPYNYLMTMIEKDIAELNATEI